MEIERHPAHRQELFFRTFKALNIAALGLRVESKLFIERFFALAFALSLAFWKCQQAG